MQYSTLRSISHCVYLPLGRACLSGIPDGSLGPVHQHLAGQVIDKHNPQSCGVEAKGDVPSEFVVLVQILIALNREMRTFNLELHNLYYN